MKAVRVLQFGPPSVITNVDLPRPEPGTGQLLVHVKAAGVGNWDALVREGKLPNEHLPLILGYELAGIVEGIGTEASGFKLGDEVYEATNEQLTGAGNVGAYAVQLAKLSDLHVVATAASADLDYVRGLGAERVVDYKKERFEESLNGVDIVLDTVGGDTQQRSLQVLKPGGILVSVVSPVPEAAQKRYGVRAAYFYVDVTTARLNTITQLFDSGKLATNVGTVLPLEQARTAHEMLGGEPHKRGKIVLSVAA
jgi:NADPH:quinone reductase-like Zn-dependent oxidoreductase